jgi:ATP phosphoribosyltransferase
MSKIKLGLPSKGRLKNESIKLFSSKNLNIQNTNSRNYFFNFKENDNFDGIFLHAREIIERISDGTLDAGISGLDLLMELPDEYQNNIKILKKLDFGFADLVVAVPNDWLDIQNIADLEEVSFDFKEKYNRRMRVATKYPKLTEEFLLSRGVIEFKIVGSLGATESYPFTGSAEFITDITSTGSTLKENNLRIISDGKILKSSACLFVSKNFKGMRLNLLKKLIS